MLQSTLQQKAANEKTSTFLFRGELSEDTLKDIEKGLKNVIENDSTKKVIFDFSELNFINSKGIAFLIGVQNRLAKKRRKLIISGATGTVMDVMTLVGLTSIITVIS